MKEARRTSEDDGNAHDSRGQRAQPTLQAASLGSPFFRESWSAGAPLNWLEFVERGRAEKPSRIAVDRTIGDP